MRPFFVVGSDIESEVDPALRDADRSAVDTLASAPIENLPSPKTIAAKQQVLV